MGTGAVAGKEELRLTVAGEMTRASGQLIRGKWGSQEDRHCIRDDAGDAGNAGAWEKDGEAERGRRGSGHTSWEIPDRMSSFVRVR